MPSIANTGIPNWFPTTCSCFTAAGLYTSHATSKGLFPCFLRRFASFPEVVVLPDPCSPTIIYVVGGLLAKVTFAGILPSNSINSSWTILMTCCPGVRLSRTSCPTARSDIFVIKSLTTLKFTSASNNASFISRIISLMSFSVTLPLPRNLFIVF